MPKKVKARPAIKFSETDFPPSNQSIVSMNNSHLHPAYKSYVQPTVSRCFHCSAAGLSDLRKVCNCVDKMFHEECLKQWIKIKTKTPGVYIDTNDQINSIRCQNCEQGIKFKHESKSRIRNCSELSFYCSNHKVITFSIIFSIMIILGCATYLLLLQLSIVPICNCYIEKSVLMIALGVILSFFLLALSCCCLDCLRVKQTRISTLGGRQDKSQRNYKKSSRGNRLVVVSVQ